jgi:hypothetical protein
MDKREGYKIVATLPDGELCVGIVEISGRVIVATTKHVYELIGDKIEKIPIEHDTTDDSL